MAVVWVKEMGHGMRGRYDGVNRRTYTRTFQVKVSNKADGPAIVLAATGIPRRNDQYATTTDVDLGARCVSLEHHETESPYLRRVEAEYSTDSPDPLQQVENPLLRPAEIDYSGVRFSKPFDKDVNGRSILNSAKRPFDPPLERDDTRGVLIITRNEPIFNMTLADLYQDTVNSDNFFGRPRDSWKCQPMRGRNAYENGVAFVIVTYEFEFRKEGWRFEPLDQGKYGYDVTTRKYTIFTDSTGLPLTEPIPLNGQGGKLSDAVTALSANITADDLQITVGSTAIIPSIGANLPKVYIRIDDEILEITGVNDPKFTVSRGAQGTTAAAHTAGANKVKMEPYYFSYQGYEERPFALLALP